MIWVWEICDVYWPPRPITGIALPLPFTFHKLLYLSLQANVIQKLASSVVVLSNQGPQPIQQQIFFRILSAWRLMRRTNFGYVMILMNSDDGQSPPYNLNKKCVIHQKNILLWPAHPVSETSCTVTIMNWHAGHILPRHICDYAFGGGGTKIWTIGIFLPIWNGNWVEVRGKAHAHALSTARVHPRTHMRDGVYFSRISRTHMQYATCATI